MKRILLIFPVIFLLVNASCKKGDEDPALSLLSRKSRLTGQWKMTKTEGNTVSETGEVYNTIMGDEHQITTETGIPNPTSYIRTEVITEFSIEFNKDGTWKQIIHGIIEDLTDNGTYTYSTTREEYYLAKGKWSFMRKTKDQFKNRERLLIETTSDSLYIHPSQVVTHYYTTGDPDDIDEGPGGIYLNDYGFGTQTLVVELIRLTNKEMKWRLEQGGGWYFSELDSSYTSGGSTDKETFFTWTKN